MFRAESKLWPIYMRLSPFSPNLLSPGFKYSSQYFVCNIQNTKLPFLCYIQPMCSCEVWREAASIRHYADYFPVTLSIPPTSQFMLIHFTAMHCPPGSLKTVLVPSSFDFRIRFILWGTSKGWWPLSSYYYSSAPRSIFLSSITPSTTSRGAAILTDILVFRKYARTPYCSCWP